MKSLALNTLALAVVFAIASGCGGSKKIPATTDWRSQAVTVDGKLDDWQQPLRYANSATGLNYSIANDGEKLYICFTTTDGRALAKMTMGGLQVEVAAPGTAPATLLYPIPGTIQPDKGSSKKQEQQNKKSDWQLSDQATSLQVSGFPFAKTATELPLMNKFGANVATNFTKDRFVYELSMPLEGLNLKDKEIAITITLKGLPKSQMQSSFNGMQQGSNMGGVGGGPMGYGGGYGGYGGGYGGGGGFRGPSSNPAYAAMFSDKKISLSTRLAVAQ